VTHTTLRVMSDLIEPHLRHLRARGFARNTIEDRAKVLRRLDADLPLGIEEATVDELEDWLVGPDPVEQPDLKPWSNQTKATYQAHIKGFYEWGHDSGHLDWNPAATLKRPKVPRTMPRPVSTDELKRLIQQCDEPYRLWVILAAYEGLRAFEIATIRREDITEDLTTVRGKGGKNAVVPTHEMVWRAVRHLPPGPLVPRKPPATGDHISKRFGEYLREKLEIHGITLHRMRHWLGTTALRECKNLRVVQGLLRHSSPSTTAIYTEITDEERRTAIAALPVFNAPAST
jgi:integrase